MTLEWSQTLECGKVNYANAVKAVAKLNAENSLGYADWRLPEIRELLSLVDYTRAKPAIDVEAFPDTKRDWYWTTSSYAGDPDYAWIVNFSNGNASWGYRRYGGFVRAVRGPGARASQPEKDYDHTDAAYIFKQLLRIHEQQCAKGVHAALRGEGDLGEMITMWDAAIEAAQVLNEIVHEDEFERRGVWAYEMLDDDRLALVLWLNGCHNVRVVVTAWCVTMGIQLKGQAIRGTERGTAIQIIEDFVEALEGSHTEEDWQALIKRGKNFVEAWK